LSLHGLLRKTSEGLTNRTSRRSTTDSNTFPLIRDLTASRNWLPQIAYRIRVGDYRVVYEIEDDVLVVLVIRIAHRKDVYR
jgi:mRNA-degrading endonuclease RelE of RelBE toxin-antitoxin system